MSDNHEGIIVILSSPSGAGKTSLVKEISSKNNYSISISHTTRKPRSNEIDGKDYFFISEKKLTSLLVLIIIRQLGIGLKGLSLPLMFKSQATFSGADIKI